jgi:hypothetical protein
MEIVVLMGMVGFVLLVTCANVANLLGAPSPTSAMQYARAPKPRGRFSQNLIPPPSRRSQPRDRLLGIGSSSPPPLQKLRFSAAPDAPILAFAAGVSLLSSVVFGLAPALQASRASLVQTLRTQADSLAGSRGALRLPASSRPSPSRSLLVGAGLFARSLHNLRRLDPGFDPRPVVPSRSSPPAPATRPRDAAPGGRLQRDLAALPGVVSATAAEISILTNSVSSSSSSSRATPGPDERVAAQLNYVAPDFFRTLQIPLLRGRAIDERDGEGAPRVAVVNESLAKRYFGPGEAVGKRFGFGRRGNPAEIEVVGIVRDGRHSSLRDEVPLMAYVPHAQTTDRTGGATFYLRASGDPAALASAAREAVRRADPALPVNDVATMAAVVDDSILLDRLSAWLSAAFGLLATALAASACTPSPASSWRGAPRDRAAGGARGDVRSVLALVLRDVLRRRSSGSPSACRWPSPSGSSSRHGSSACARPIPPPSRRPRSRC